MERRRAPLPPLSVTQRIPARPDAAGLTGALISVLRRTETERRSASLPESRAPHRGEACWERDSPRATGLKKLRSVYQDTFYILFCPFPSYLLLHICAIISHTTVLSGWSLRPQFVCQSGNGMWNAAFVLPLWVLSVSAELRQDTEPRRLPPPGKLDFGYVPAGVYETVAHYEPGPIGILFQLVQGFLHIVQPNAFPQGKDLHAPQALIPSIPALEYIWIHSSVFLRVRFENIRSPSSGFSLILTALLP